MAFSRPYVQSILVFMNLMFRKFQFWWLEFLSNVVDPTQVRIAFRKQTMSWQNWVRQANIQM